MEVPIHNLSIYTNRMQKSVMDKLFFIDKIFEPFSNVVDFGCANGELIRIMQLLFGEHRYIGYDISEQMLSAARVNVPTAEFYADWDQIDVDFKDSLLNISSTLHEVYSYSTKAQIDVFWERVFGSGFRYIAIRDMMLSNAQEGTVDPAQYALVAGDAAYADKRKDYEAVWGKITTQRDLIHYLLKYKYAENWAREVRENYIPITLEQLLEMIPEEYEIVYQDHFTLPYTAWQVKKDFGIQLTAPTHIKLILKKGRD